MKKLKCLIVSLVSIFAFNINVFAASGSLSVSSSSVYVGDSFTVSVNVYSSAAWNVHVSTSGPVSGCVINQADATADAMDTNKTFSATCTATGTGTITIRLSGDVTSALDGNAVGISGSRSVTVSTRPTPPSNSGNSSRNNSGSNNSNNNYTNNNRTNNKNSNNNKNRNNNSNNTAADNKSNNSNIKELSVVGFELLKVDSNNYALTVPNDVESINIKASAEDSKAQLTGSGNHSINVGENNIEVIVTAEDGSQNKINVKVTRKDGYYLDDLDLVLKSNKNNDITIKFDTKITFQDLEKIKNSKKIINFNYYNADKSLMYSWVIDGSKLKDVNDLLTTISFDSDNKKDILRLSNYADGLFVGLKQISNLPMGSRVKLFVGDKYEDSVLVNIYAYLKSKDKLELVKSKVKVENGYIEFDVMDASDYLVTMSNVPNLSAMKKDNKKSSYFPFVIGILLVFCIIFLIILFKNKRKKEDKNNSEKHEKVDVSVHEDNLNLSDNLTSQNNGVFTSGNINNLGQSVNDRHDTSINLDGIVDDDYEYLTFLENNYSKNTDSNQFDGIVSYNNQNTSDNMSDESEKGNE